MSILRIFVFGCKSIHKKHTRIRSMSEHLKRARTGVGTPWARGGGGRRAGSTGFYSGRGGCRAEGGGQAPDDGSDANEPGLQPQPQHLHAQARPGATSSCRSMHKVQLEARLELELELELELGAYASPILIFRKLKLKYLVRNLIASYRVNVGFLFLFFSSSGWVQMKPNHFRTARTILGGKKQLLISIEFFSGNRVVTRATIELLRYTVFWRKTFSVRRGFSTQNRRNVFLVLQCVFFNKYLGHEMVCSSGCTFGSFEISFFLRRKVESHERLGASEKETRVGEYRHSGG